MPEPSARTMAATRRSAADRRVDGAISGSSHVSVSSVKIRHTVRGVRFKVGHRLPGLVDQVVHEAEAAGAHRHVDEVCPWPVAQQLPASAPVNGMSLAAKSSEPGDVLLAPERRALRRRS